MDVCRICLAGPWMRTTGSANLSVQRKGDQKSILGEIKCSDVGGKPGDAAKLELKRPQSQNAKGGDSFR